MQLKHGYTHDEIYEAFLAEEKVFKWGMVYIGTYCLLNALTISTLIWVSRYLSPQLTPYLIYFVLSSFILWGVLLYFLSPLPKSTKPGFGGKWE